MIAKNLYTKAQLKALLLFLKNNKGSDLANANLKDADVVSGFKWHRLSNKKEEVLKMMEAYQRLSNIMPYEDQELILFMLSEGFHSALQIAAIPKDKFLSKYLERFGNDQAMADKFYNNALAVKTRVLLQYMQAKQQGEPHISQTNLSVRI